MLSKLNRILLSAALLLPSALADETVSEAASQRSVQPFFTALSLYDAYTLTNVCTDLNQWFVVEAEVFIPYSPVATANSTIQLTVPQAFDSFPTYSFDLMVDENAVGNVVNLPNSNIFEVTVDPKLIKENTTTTFSFMAKLNPEYLYLISEPMTVSYVFNTSSPDISYTPEIVYAQKSLKQISTDGGINNTDATAWFTIDIPVSELIGQRYTIYANPMNKTSFVYDLNATSFEIVTQLDAFNNPVKSVPFFSAIDLSVADQMKFLVDVDVSGGKYLRIKYQGMNLTNNHIQNIVTVYNTSLTTNTTEVSTTVANLFANAVADINIEELMIESDGEADSPTNVFQDRNSDFEFITTLVHETFVTDQVYSKFETEEVTELANWIPITTLSGVDSTSTGPATSASINKKPAVVGVPSKAPSYANTTSTEKAEAEFNVISIVTAYTESTLVQKNQTTTYTTLTTIRSSVSPIVVTSVSAYVYAMVYTKSTEIQEREATTTHVSTVEPVTHVVISTSTGTTYTTVSGSPKSTSVSPRTSLEYAVATTDVVYTSTESARVTVIDSMVPITTLNTLTTKTTSRNGTVTSTSSSLVLYTQTLNGRVTAVTQVNPYIQPYLGEASKSYASTTALLILFLFVIL